MGYLFIASLILVLATFFAVSIECDYKRIKKIAEQKLAKAKTFTWGKIIPLEENNLNLNNERK